MTSLYVVLIYASFLVVGFTAPFVFTLGYLWVDVFYPQFLTPLLASVPVSLIMAVAAGVSYFLADRRAAPRFTAHGLLTICFALWCTLSLTWAVAPVQAWAKWDWAFKSLMFSAFLPYVLRTRVQIEAFLQVLLFAMTLHMLPLGIKNMLSGSSYGRNLGIENANILLLESSTLAAASISMIPLVLFLRKHTLLLPKSKITDAMYFFLIGVAVLCAIGTYARTALIGFIVVGAFLWLQSKRKVLFTVCVVVLALGFGYTASKSWEARIDTTTSYNTDTSALGRILVWKWTLGFVASNPLGGGFNAFYIDTIEFPPVDGAAPVIIHGKAFHNIYIEVLGEQGFPGLAMFVAIQLLSLFYLRTIRRRTRDRPEQLWCYDLAGALMTSLLVLLACGNFVGIGYQSIIWYALVMPVCLYGYIRQVERLDAGNLAPQRAVPQRPSGLVAMPRPAR